MKEINDGTVGGAATHNLMEHWAELQYYILDPVVKAGGATQLNKPRWRHA